MASTFQTNAFPAAASRRQRIQYHSSRSPLDDVELLTRPARAGICPTAAGRLHRDLAAPITGAPLVEAELHRGVAAGHHTTTATPGDRRRRISDRPSGPATRPPDRSSVSWSLPSVQPLYSTAARRPARSGATGADELPSFSTQTRSANAAAAPRGSPSRRSCPSRRPASAAASRSDARAPNRVARRLVGQQQGRSLSSARAIAPLLLPALIASGVVARWVSSTIASSSSVRRSIWRRAAVTSSGSEMSRAR